MDSTLLEYWFEHCLLRTLSVSSTIVLDNAAFHRKKQLALLTQKYNHKLVFLPPYSPQFNPIEHFWDWLKQFLRSHMHRFPSFDSAPSFAFISALLYLEKDTYKKEITIIFNELLKENYYENEVYY